MKTLIAILLLSIALPAPAAERDLLKDAGTLIFSGKAGDARPLLREAQAAFRASKDVQHEAIAALMLGLADAKARDIPAARTDLDDAARKLEAANDDFGAWFALLVLAQLELDEGQSRASIAVYERALARLKHLAEPAQPFSAESFRVFAQNGGMPTQMFDMVMGQPMFAKMLFLPLAETMLHDQYGVALMEIGDLTRAETELNAARGAAAAVFGGMLTGMFDSSILVHIGDLRRRQWRLDEARESYLKAIESAKQLGAMPFATNAIDIAIMGKLAELEALSGCTDEAVMWNDRALAMVAGDPTREVPLIEARGGLLMQGGDYASAEASFNEALSLAERTGDLYQQASVLTSLGWLDFSRGDYGQSAARLEKAIALYERVGESAAYVEAAVFIMLAEDYLQLEQPASVADVVKRGTALAEKSRFPIAGALLKIVGDASQGEHDLTVQQNLQTAMLRFLQLQEVRGVLGEAADRLGAGYGGPLAPTTSIPPVDLSSMADMRAGIAKIQSGDMAGARTILAEAEKKNPSRDLRSGIHAMIGATYIREKKYDEAIPYFQQAVDDIENMFDDIKVQEQLAGFLGSSRRWYFDLLIEMLLEKRRMAEAFDYSERARARAFLQLVGNTRLNATRRADSALTAEAEQLRRDVTRLQTGGAPASVTEQRRKEYEGLLLRVKTSNPEYASMARVDTLGLDAVRAELPPDTTLISYFVTPLRLHAWVIDRDSATYVPLGAKSEALHAALCWADDFERTGEAVRGTESLQNPCTGRRATADEVFDLLIAPLQSHLRNRRLIVVPHGPLHYIPFAALLDPASGRYLVEEYVLTYAPSASALRFLRGKRSAPRGKALVLGDPDSAERALSGASCEAVSVSGDLGVKPLLGPRATESVLYHLDGKIDLLHIAAHAGYNSGNPLFSEISLARDSEQDGNLQVHEILSDLDLSGVNLVVLSACRTALGARSGGDEIVGLTRALLYAGSPAVISTLWDISDQASAPLMEDFYRRLRAGESAADALRGAQMTMLQDPNYSDPKYWAAFNLTGDPLAGWK